MKIEEIDELTFDLYSKKHTLKNYYQSSYYADVSLLNGYKINYIGFFINNKLEASSLILTKTISNIKYGYAPRGFLVNYYDYELLKVFTKYIKKYFYSKGYAFIKINPEVTLSILDKDNNVRNINESSKILVDNLRKLGYLKLKDSLYKNYILTKYSNIIDLDNYRIDNNYIGFKCENININELNNILDNKDYSYYSNLCKDNNLVDILSIKLDYNDYIKYLQKDYEEAYNRNVIINNKFKNEPTNNEIYKEKIKSDELLEDASKRIKYTNEKLGLGNTEVIGYAIITKYEGRASAVYIKCKDLDNKELLYDSLINKYKNDSFKYFDYNDIDNDNIYEFIGEYDLIINKTLHTLLFKTGKIAKEFIK